LDGSSIVWNPADSSFEQMIWEERPSRSMTRIFMGLLNALVMERRAFFAFMHSTIYFGPGMVKKKQKSQKRPSPLFDISGGRG